VIEPRSKKRLLSRFAGGMAILGAATVLALVWFSVRTPRGPTYRGRAIGYYFPRWVSPNENYADTKRWPSDAGADAVTFLIHVLGTRDSKAWLPTQITHRLPWPQPAEAIRLNAFEHLPEIIHSDSRAARTSE